LPPGLPYTTPPPAFKILDVELGQAAAERIDFGIIFRDVEGEDEEAASLGDDVKVVAALMPAKVEVRTSVCDLSDEELLEIIGAADRLGDVETQH
jgi:hypothetical protein